MSMECPLSVNRAVDKVLIKYRSNADRVLIRGIDQHSTVDAFSTHNPVNLHSEYSTWKKMTHCPTDPFTCQSPHFVQLSHKQVVTP